MSFTVRVFGFRGIVQMPQINPQQLQTDSVSTLNWPYEWAQQLAVSGSSPPAFNSSPVSPDLSHVLRIEVPDGQAIRYEINPPNRNVVVSSSSPSISGKNNFNWGPGWSLSICDALAFP